MIQYLKYIVCKNISSFLQKNKLPPFSVIFFIIVDDLSDKQINQAIYDDECTIVFYQNMHKCNSNCHKYKNTQNCHYQFSQALKERTVINEHKIIHLHYNYSMLNSFNSAIAASIRFNHNLTFIFIKNKMFSLVYYMTNYTIKDDNFLTQILLKTAFLKTVTDEFSDKQN